MIRLVWPYIYYFGLPQTSSSSRGRKVWCFKLLYGTAKLWWSQKQLSYDGLRNDKVMIVQILVWFYSIDYQYQCCCHYQPSSASIITHIHHTCPHMLYKYVCMFRYEVNHATFMIHLQQTFTGTVSECFWGSTVIYSNTQKRVVCSLCNKQRIVNQEQMQLNLLIKQQTRLNLS